MGDPVPVRVAGPRTVVRHLPVDAYSLAVSCGSRGVSLDIWPASLFGTRRAARCPLPGHDRFTPRPARHVAPRPGSRHAKLFARQARGPSRALAASLAVVVRLPPRATANVAYGALRCVVDRLPLLRCSEALGQHSQCCHHAGLFVPATSPVATDVCGHHTTASSRGHQRSC